MINDFNLESISINTNIIKMFFMGIFVYYTYFKIINVKIEKNKRKIIDILCLISISIIISIIRYKINYLISIIVFIFLVTLLCSHRSKNNIGNSLVSVVISYGINYAILFIATFFTFLINMIKAIESDYINLGILIIIQSFILYYICKIKRVKNGIVYLNKRKSNNLLDIIILNISIIICFSSIIFANIDRTIVVSRSLYIGFIVFAIIMFITIQKSIQLYYKQKLMVKDLNETKADLEKAKQEIDTLEKENIELSKKNHSFKHQYKSLKHKVDELMEGDKSAAKDELSKDLQNLSKDIYVAPKNTELDKTGITEIDDMLNCMKADCDKKNISFTLQIIGSVYHIINNLISKEELEILLADHIKDAIIAIEHSDNVNKSIIVKLGKVDNNYGLYIYDSGIEFEKETLENLGKKPVTTHKDEGGSGMGFMNTFDTLKNHNASLIIEEIGAPSKDNFTKIIKIIFDGKNDYKVIPY